MLGQLLADISETDYPTLLSQVVLNPLAMQSTTTELTDKRQVDACNPLYARRNSSNPWELGSFIPAGGLRSNIDDMMLFAKSNLTPPEGQLGKAIDLAWNPLINR